MKSYNITFLKREFKAILGKRCSNFWILWIVFTLTVGALAFSRAGLAFLGKKMNDPFIKWIQVRRQADFELLQQDILRGTIARDSFGIATIESNNFILEYVFTSDFRKWRVEGRTIAANSQLLPKILDEENIVVKCSRGEMSSNDFGWIVTADLMKNLGYEDEENYPLFINYTYPGQQEMIDSLGIENFDGFIVIPIPIIAVVQQLPDLVDFIAPKYFREQVDSHNNPFNVSIHSIYYQDLVLVVENSDEELEDKINKKLKSSGLLYDEEWETSGVDFEYSLRDATQYRIIVRDSNISHLNTIAKEICEIPNVYRFYNYEFDKGEQLIPDYMSFMFDDLNKVQRFAKWAKNNYGVRIEMAQIEAKNNFSIFNRLANGLCLVIMAISILFVVIFLWFLINGHFRKISKNLGTIMAFGLANKSIILVYLIVFMRLILRSLLFSVIILCIIQYASVAVGYVRMVNAVEMPWINMFDKWVTGLIVGIIMLSIIVTFLVLRRKLHTTPGNLIFGRNN